MKKMIALILSVLMLTSALLLPSTGAQTTEPLSDAVVAGLEVNHFPEALGIDTNPIFQWTVNAPGYSRAQTAYRILVSSTPEKSGALEGDLWDSGKVTGENNYDISYEGSPLSSKTAYYWRVMIWDEEGAPSEWSAVGSFETGILDPNSWSAQWIGADQGVRIPVGMDYKGSKWIWYRNGAAADQIPAETMYFRKTFIPNPQKTVDRVFVGFSADDNSKLFVNGEQASESTHWKNGVAAEIKDYLTDGENVIAFSVVNTTVGYSGLLVKMEVRYTDGSKDTYLSDESWKLSKSAPSGWNTPSFDDSGWLAPDQAVAYGGAPWGTTSVIPQEIKGELKEASAPMLRKSFEITKPVQTARAYICGLGLFDMKINGQHADDSVLNPAHTQYEDTVDYRVFDVTGLLRQGENAIGVELGKSFYNEVVDVWNWQNAVWRDSPKLIMELTITYEDGTSETIVTDESWKCYQQGPTTFDSIYFGDYYDARLEVPGWDAPGFDDTAWDTAALAKAPQGVLTFENMEPMRRVNAYTPTVTKMEDGSYLVKSPYMITGWAKFTFNAPAGTEITMNYGEKLNNDGTMIKTVPYDSFQKPNQEDHYICKGEANETFEPKFSYKGYQYITVEGYEGELRPEDIVCYQIHNDVDIISEFESSNEMINTLHEIQQRTILNNFQGKPTDTPTFEKNGWTGDANVTLETMSFNFDYVNFMEKWIGDMEDSQDANGSVPNIVPTANWGMANTPVWNMVFIFAVDELYNYYGYESLIEKYYDSMRKLALLSIQDIEKNGWVWQDGQLADWASPQKSEFGDGYGSMPSEGSGICGTGYVYQSLKVMAEFAEKLGRSDEASEYRSAMEKIYEAFNKKFYNADKGYYETSYWLSNTLRDKFRQTSQLVPLAFDMVPDEYRESVAKALADDVVRKGYHLDVGMVGTKYLLPILSESGYPQLAYAVLTQTSYPSWGYWLENGATSAWEQYMYSARSRNHYFLANYDEWFFKYLCGVQNVEDGYRTFTIDPELTGELDYAKTSIETRRGALHSGWSRTGEGAVTYDITVPFGSRASIYLPTASAVDVTLNGAFLTALSDGVQAIETEEGRLKLTVGSGSYQFVCKDETNALYTLRLEQELSRADGLVESEYLPDAWAGFKLVYDAARETLQTAHSQGAVNQAADDLSAAIETLAGFTNDERIALNKALSEADSIEPEKYPADAWDVWTKALATIKKDAEPTTLSPEELRALAGRLNAALEALSESRRDNLALDAAPKASSNVGGNWDLKNINNGDTEDFIGGGYRGWSSNNSPAVDHTEWVMLDFGAKVKFNKIVLYPPYITSGLSYGLPRDFEIQVSSDGESWTSLHSESDYPVAAYGKHTFKFEPTFSRYVRIYAESLNPKPSDGNLYRMQISEFEVYFDPFSADMTDLNALIDKADALNPDYYYPGAWDTFVNILSAARLMAEDISASQADVDEMAGALTAAMSVLEEQKHLAKIALLQKIAEAEGLELASYTPASQLHLNAHLAAAKEAAELDASDTALSYAASALGKALDRMEPASSANLALGKPVTVSSSVEMATGRWSKALLTNGDPVELHENREYRGWSSDSDWYNPDHEEWVILDLQNVVTFNTVDLYPTGAKTADPLCYGFPVDFTISVSTDKESWDTVYTAFDCPIPERGVKSYSFGSVSARYVKVTATRLNPKASDSNICRMQLAEIEVYRHAAAGTQTVFSPATALRYEENAALYSVLQNAPFTIQAITSGDVEEVFLLNENGMKLSLLSCTSTPNEDGTKTWALTTGIATVGKDRRLTVHAVGANGAIQPDGAEVSFSVEAPVPVVQSAQFEAETSPVNTPTMLKVVTDQTVAKLDLYNEYGVKMSIPGASYEDTPGERVWTVPVSASTAGTRSFRVFGKNKFGMTSEPVATNSIHFTYF